MLRAVSWGRCRLCSTCGGGPARVRQANPGPIFSGNRRLEMRGSSPEAAVTHRHTPVVTELRVVPVAGHDSMLMNLSGAHGPFFTRNIVILKDSANNTGLGEVPGGEKIRQTLEDAREL